MDATVRTAFLLLVLAQAAHSLEEYVFRLYDFFAPARFVSGLVSENLALGFAVVNIGIVLFGIWCYVARVRPGHLSAPLWIWPWVAVEAMNGILHPAIALSRRAYFPGAVSAPILAVLSLYLAVRLIRPSARR
jgi:hypothetical protein